MYRKFIVPAAVVVTLLSGCVQDGDIERGAIGAGIGCLAGEVLRDGACVEGAVLGGGAGVLSNRL
ncbi:MAG: hypothetical protein WBA67_10125 [Jannaschia sp.]